MVVIVENAERSVFLTDIKKGFSILLYFCTSELTSWWTNFYDSIFILVLPVCILGTEVSQWNRSK